MHGFALEHSRTRAARVLSSAPTSWRTVDVLGATLVTGEDLHAATQRRGLLRKAFATDGAVFAHLQELLPHG